MLAAPCQVGCLRLVKGCDDDDEVAVGGSGGVDQSLSLDSEGLGYTQSAPA